MPPSQNKSPQETKQDARRLRKLKQDMTRRQEVFRLKRLHEHNERTRELPVMSNNTFHAASVGTISQGRTYPEYRSLMIPEKSKPVPMDSDSISDSDHDNLIITSVETADITDMLTLI